MEYHYLTYYFHLISNVTQFFNETFSCHDDYADIVELSHVVLLQTTSRRIALAWHTSLPGCDLCAVSSARVGYSVTATMCVSRWNMSNPFFYRSQHLIPEKKKKKEKENSFPTPPPPPPPDHHPTPPSPSELRHSTSVTCFALRRKAMFSEALIVLFCFCFCLFFFCTSVKTIFIAVYCWLDFKASSIWGCMVLSLAVAQPSVSVCTIILRISTLHHSV